MILTFIFPSGRERTGGVVVLYEFANALARLGHEVHFVHGPARPTRVDSLDELDHFGFEEGVHHHLVDSLDDPTVPDGDIVFHPNVAPRLGLPAVFVQGARFFTHQMERETFRSRAPKICVANWLLDVGREFGVPEEQLWHVRVGIDHDLFALRTRLDERTVDVALLRNTHKPKGWVFGLEALEKLRGRRPGLRATIFGMREPNEAPPEWVTFLQAPDHRTLADEVYNATRVFVQPSLHEGFGLTAVEAMACGAALVTTDNGGSRDYAVAGETALVVPPGDSTALADAVERLLADDGQRIHLAAAGERYVRRFDWDRSAEVLERHLGDYLVDPQRFREAPADDGHEGNDGRESNQDDLEEVR